MDNQQAKEKIEDLNLFFETAGFTDEEKKDHMARMMTLVFAAVADNLDKVTAIKEKEPFPEMESPTDFYNYYEKYIDRATIDKVIEEETYKIFSEYFKAVADEMPE